MNYYQVTNTGKGFITHEDHELSPITQFPGEIWGTDNIAWAERVGATLITLEEAQTIVNTILQSQYDIEIASYKPEYTFEQQNQLNQVKKRNKILKKNSKELLEVPIFEPLNKKPVLKVITLS